MLIRRLVSVLVLALALSAIWPAAHAHAYYQQLPVPATYKGWAHVRHFNPDCDRSPYPPSCPMFVMQPSRSAWRWTGSSWQQTRRADGTQVYAWPFAAGWTWTWTSRDGWLAMRSSDVVLRYM